jgi:hypothetical protein
VIQTSDDDRGAASAAARPPITESRGKVVFTISVKAGHDPQRVIEAITEALGNLGVRSGLEHLQVEEVDAGGQAVANEQLQAAVRERMGELLDAKARDYGEAPASSQVEPVRSDDPQFLVELNLLLDRERETLERLA